MFNRKHTVASKQKMSASAKKRIKAHPESVLGFVGKHHTDKAKMKIAGIVRQSWDNGEHAKHHSDSIKKKISVKAKEHWGDPVYVRKVMCRREMSGPELTMMSIIGDLPMVFTGNGQLVVDGKNPDFAHATEKRLIEVWGDFFHRGQDPNERINFFKARGYECMIIWASELKDIAKVTEKVNVFIKVGNNVPS